MSILMSRSIACRTQIVMFLVTSSLLTACGQSPLLNHVEALSPGASDQKLNQSPRQQTPCDVQFTNLEICGRLTWISGPQIGDDSPFTVAFFAQGGSTADSETATELPGNLKIQLWMPSMGHGSAAVKITSLGNGVYQVTNVQFLMAGDWDIRFWVQDTSGKRLDSTKIELSL